MTELTNFPLKYVGTEVRSSERCTPCGRATNFREVRGARKLVQRASVPTLLTGKFVTSYRDQERFQFRPLPARSRSHVSRRPGAGCLLVGRGQRRSEAESERLRTPRRAKGTQSGPSGASSSASHAATTCSDWRFRVLPCASRAVMRGDLGDHLQACGSTVTAPTGTGRGHQARDIAAQSVRWHRPPLPSHGSPPRRSG